MTNEILTHPTYDQIHQMCVHLAAMIKSENIQPDRIVGIVRGGTLPATILSHLLNVPMRAIHYSSKDGAGDDKNYLNVLPEINAKRLLIVDDISDTGETLREISTEYFRRNQRVFTASLYYKDVKTGMYPDFFSQLIPADAPWIIFPFEQEDGNVK